MLQERSKRNTIVVKYEKNEISQVKDPNRNNVFDKIQCS